MKKAVPYLITLILLIVMGGVFFKLYYDHYMYTDERADLDEYYGVQDKDDFPIIYENLVSDMHARRFDGEIYLDLEPRYNLFCLTVPQERNNTAQTSLPRCKELSRGRFVTESSR